MEKLYFITGNKNKAKYAQKLLGIQVENIPLDLSEIQSLSLTEVIKNKLHLAFSKINAPVIVEDISLEFVSLGKLPGTFIKFFLLELGPEGLCRLLKGYQNKKAILRCVIGYKDENKEQFFESVLHGEIAAVPKGSGGFGFDSIFIKAGQTKTNAQLSKKEYESYYLEIRPFEKLRLFLAN